MTQQTDNFKNTQIPLWETGDIADGANFRQLIEAIAALVDSAVTDGGAEVTQNIEAAKQEAIARAQELANAAKEAAKTEAEQAAAEAAQAKVDAAKQELENEITQKLNDAKTELDAKVDEKLANKKQEIANSVKDDIAVFDRYDYANSTVTLKSSVKADKTKAVTLTTGAELLPSSVTDVAAIRLGSDDKFLLIRESDGAQLYLNGSTLKPAANLIS